jgi:hypothetical protein
MATDELVVTQEDIDNGVEFYCLCHGWRRLAALDDLCPKTYASTATVTNRQEP